MKYYSRIQRKNGFTLIEVILAALLFSIIAVSIYLIFSQGLRIEKRLRQSSGGAQAAFFAVQRFVNDLTHIVPYKTCELNETYFTGMSQSISFIAEDRSGLTKIGYKLVEPEQKQIYRLEVDRTSKGVSDFVLNRQTKEWVSASLVRESSRFLQYDEEGFKSEILVKDVLKDSLKFSYLGKDDNGTMTWFSEWNQQELPFAVQIDVTALNDDGNLLQIVRKIFVLSQKEEF